MTLDEASISILVKQPLPSAISRSFESCEKYRRQCRPASRRLVRSGGFGQGVLLMIYLISSDTLVEDIRGKHVKYSNYYIVAVSCEASDSCRHLHLGPILYRRLVGCLRPGLGSLSAVSMELATAARGTQVWLAVFPLRSKSFVKSRLLL